jgi:hypothetical protein
MELPEKVDLPMPQYPVPLTAAPAATLESGVANGAGDLCKLVDGPGGPRTVLPLFGHNNLPSPQELKTWDRPSQEAYWEQRRAAYNRMKLTELQRDCRKCQIWPGGDLPQVKDRLMRYDWGQHDLCV